MIEFTKYGFGVSFDGDVIDKKEIKTKVTKWLIANFNDSFKSASLCDIPNTKDFYWVSWKENLDESLDRICARSEMCTTSCYVDSSRYLNNASYSSSFHSFFNPHFIYNKCKKYIGIENKKAIILGCGTGEGILSLESYGIETIGMDNCLNSFSNANKLAYSNMVFGDFLVDTKKYNSKYFDLVYTDRSSLIHKYDIQAFLMEVRRICKGLFIQDFVSFDNSFKKRKDSWWKDMYEEVGMTYKSMNLLLCGEKDEKYNSKISKIKNHYRK